MPERPPIGGMLLRQGRITPEQLEKALALHHRCGSPLGQVMLGEGYASALALARAVAEQLGLPYVDALKSPPDPALLRAEEREDYLALGLLPWRREGETTLLLTPRPTPENTAWARARFGEAFAFRITAYNDIRWCVERAFARDDDEDSRLALWKRSPEASARTLGSPRASRIAAPLGLAAAGALALLPGAGAAAFVAVNLFYSATLAFKLTLFITGARRSEEREDDSHLYLDERKLPVYTLLIPLYRETRSLPQLFRSIRALDYPRSKLDVKLVTEADDRLTIDAIKALKPDSFFEIVRVPPSLPRTKPKACNYALRFARGEFLTIYDAEDRPEPEQLKKAVRAFMRLPGSVACLQARLNYYNRDENLLTRLFAIEYSAWFDFLLPGLQRLGIPLPLGGTSNHIALARLRALGAWDPFNVTEDADLGIRIAASGLHTAVLDSHTLEEAPVRLGAWMRQRSRWIKGYMQTWIVHMRSPSKLWKTLGPVGFFGFQLFVGAPPLVFLLAPMMWGVSLLWLAGDFAPSIPAWAGWLAALNLTTGLALHAGMAASVLTRHRAWLSPRARMHRMARAALTFPFYWVLHSFAALRAAWQLVRRPHFWEKTEHGETALPLLEQYYAMQDYRKG